MPDLIWLKNTYLFVGKKPPHEIDEQDSTPHKQINNLEHPRNPKLIIKPEKPKIPPKPKTPISENAPNPNFIMAARNNLKPVLKPPSPPVSADGNELNEDGRPRVPPKPKLRTTLFPKPSAIQTDLDSPGGSENSSDEHHDGTEV